MKTSLSIGEVGLVVAYTLGVAGLGFVLGFFGPLVLRPEANQGPLLGIFITGPLGIPIGFALGMWRVYRRRSHR